MDGQTPTHSRNNRQPVPPQELLFGLTEEMLVVVALSLGPNRRTSACKPFAYLMGHVRGRSYNLVAARAGSAVLPLVALIPAKSLQSVFASRG